MDNQSATAPPNAGPKRSAIVLLSIIAATLLAVLSLLGAVLSNPLTSLPQAALAAIAAIGLKRGNPWAGYGLALFLLCSTGGAAYAKSRVGSPLDSHVLASAILLVMIAALAFLAGEELAMRSARPAGISIPWLIAAAIPLAFSLFFNFMFLPTGSMEPTLLAGDTIMVRRAGAASVERGGLLVYREPDKQNVFVKRVAGVGGDRIHLDRKVLYVNGKPQREPYAIHSTENVDPYRDNFPMGDLNVPLSPRMQAQLLRQVHDGDFVVPPGTFFVLGDNRDMSLDSRYYGVIAAAAVIGKPVLVCFSAELPAVTPDSQAPRNALVRARWKRLLKLP